MQNKEVKDEDRTQGVSLSVLGSIAGGQPVVEVGGVEEAAAGLLA